MRKRNILLAGTATVAAIVGLWVLAIRFYFGAVISVGVFGDGPASLFSHPPSAFQILALAVVLVLGIFLLIRRKRNKRKLRSEAEE